MMKKYINIKTFLVIATALLIGVVISGCYGFIAISPKIATVVAESSFHYTAIGSAELSLTDVYPVFAVMVPNSFSVPADNAACGTFKIAGDSPLTIIADSTIPNGTTTGYILPSPDTGKKWFKFRTDIITSYTQNTQATLEVDIPNVGSTLNVFTLKWFSGYMGTTNVGAWDVSSPALTTIEVVADTFPPAQITDLKPTGKTMTIVALSWTAPGDDGSTGTASSYDIRYSTLNITSVNWASATQAVGEPVPASPGTLQNFTITGLNQNTKYYFAIKTQDEVPNISVLSNVTSETTSAAPDTTPPIITAVTVESITATSATIKWNTNENSTSSVEYGTTTSYGLTKGNTPLVTAHSVGLTGLSASTTYHYRVKSTDVAGNPSASADYTFATPAVADTTPPIITAVTAESITATSATIKWNTNENSTSSVEYGTTTSYGLTIGNTPLVTAHSVGLTGLSANMTYHYRVWSTDAAGNRRFAGDFTFTVSAAADITSVTGAHNAPNPFNPDKGESTIYEFKLTGPTRVGVYIFDLGGRLIWRQEKTLTVGQVSWNGEDFLGRTAANGVYLVRVVNLDGNKLIGKCKTFVVK